MFSWTLSWLRQGGCKYDRIAGIEWNAVEFYRFCCMARSLRSLRQVATLRHGHVAPLRFAPAFCALGVCEHIWLRYKNFNPSCFDPIQKFWYVDLRTNSDFRSRSFDLLPPTHCDTCSDSIGFSTSRDSFNRSAAVCDSDTKHCFVTFHQRFR